jgi:hypothetical protein
MEKMIKEQLEKEAAAFLSEKDLKDLPGDIQKDINKDYEKMYGKDFGAEPKEEPKVESTPDEDEALRQEIQKQILEAPLLKPQIILEPEEKFKTPVKETLKEVPEANTLNAFYPDIYNQGQYFEEEKPGAIDSSSNIFAYLMSLGYREAIWGIGPEFHRDNCRKIDDMMMIWDHERTFGAPVCEDNWARTYLIENIIATANNHASVYGYWPPKPLIALSHPGCGCKLTCLPPRSIEEIPDNAPGIPSFADETILNKYKTKLLKQLHNVEVDRWAILPEDVLNINKLQRSIEEEKENTPFHAEIINANPNFKSKKKSFIEDEIIKEGKSKWEEDIKPIILNRQFIYKQALGIIRPVPASYKGFQLEKNETHAKIHLFNLGYTIEVPLEVITYVNLIPSKKDHLDAGDYLSLEGELAIVLIAHDDKKPICYIPELDDVVYIDPDDGFQILEIIK